MNLAGLSEKGSSATFERNIYGTFKVHPEKNADAFACARRDQHRCLCAWDHVAGDPVDQVLNPNGNESYTQAEYDAWRQKWAWTSRR